MKLTTQERDVTRSGNFPEATFSIAANAKAFDILSSKLYTDTRLAIVRELSTNAYDAHVEAGNGSRPFDVHLPNTFEPFFSIRDYGTGLSPEQVGTVYSTFFASTRTSSNDFVGALGLGSKSPFSYTDQFTITSYQNGKMHSYSAFKSEAGLPTIAMLNETDTTEPNGVEIRINIRQNDIADFSVAAAKVYRFFPVLPNITGARIEVARPEAIYEGDGWKMYDQSRANAGVQGRVNVVMGNICYPVTSASVVNKFGAHGILVIFAKIGECEIAASREELHYDPRTIANIQKYIDDAQTEVRKRIDDSLSQSANLVDKLRNLRRFQGLLDFAQSESRIPLEVDKQYILKRVDVRGDKLFIGRDRWSEALSPQADTQYCIIESDKIEDISQADKNRLRHYLKSVRNVLPFVAVIEDRAKFIEIFGEPTALLSKLPDAPRAVRHGFNGPRSYVKRYQGEYRRNLQYAWKMATEEPDVKDAVAVPRKGNNVIINGQTCNPEVAWSMAKAMGYKILYGIADAYYERIRKELDIPDIETEAKDFVADHVANMSDYDRCRYHTGYDLYTYSTEFINGIKGLSTTCDDLAKLSKVRDTSAEIRSMIVMFGLTVPDAPAYQEIFKKQYPLLSSVNLSYANLNDIKEYISLKETNVH